MNQFWENIYLLPEELNTGILGDMLTSQYQFLNISYCKMTGDMKDLDGLEQRLVVNKPKLRGLCLSALSGIDNFISSAVGLSPNLTVLDTSFSRFEQEQAMP